ncbi:MAG: bacillithiol system redox-active protein YtxJ [Cytophagales bacterium]|nr:bacillithiol system redox-active protein YtxJ [Cytophagales bacterium]
MKWEKLERLTQVEELKAESARQPVLVFKHSTTCPVSAMAYDRMMRGWNEEEMKEVRPYYLDLLRFREVSNGVADAFGVKHESPQVLLLKDGRCIYHTSHMGITYQELKKKVSLA